MNESVLILHYRVDTDTAASGKKVLESNAGVLQEVQAAAKALNELGIEFEIKDISCLSELPEILKNSSGNTVFNLVEELQGSPLDYCYVPALCDAYGKACTGSNTAALLIAQNKWQCKILLKGANLPCPDGMIVEPGQEFNQSKLTNGRYIVKPLFCDASEGITTDSVVDVPDRAAVNAVRAIHDQINQPALIEQFIPHRELNVSVLESDGKFSVLPLAEIDFSAFDKEQVRIVDYAAKWLSDSFAYNNTPRIIPAPLSESTAELIRQYTKQACRLIGCNDYIRVDFRLDENEMPYIIEVNPNPDISPDAGFAAAIEAAGIGYKKFIETILSNATERIQNPSSR